MPGPQQPGIRHPSLEYQPRREFAGAGQLVFMQVDSALAKRLDVSLEVEARHFAEGRYDHLIQFDLETIRKIRVLSTA
jgi:hypothetical protein